VKDQTRNLQQKWGQPDSSQCEIRRGTNRRLQFFNEMPRQARIIYPGVVHHVTQRGTNRQKIFCSQRDRKVYLDLLRHNSELSGVRILAYCLMLNHIHLVCVPESEEALAVCLRRTHGRYAQYLNARLVRSGHLWQNRFNSCPLDEQHLWTALRYVELNPVRAGLVKEAGVYRYSSAGVHLGKKDEFALVDLKFWEDSGAGTTWGESLQVEEGEEERRKLWR